MDLYRISKKPIVSSITVVHITHDGMPKVGGMPADLMGSPSQWVKLHQRIPCRFVFADGGWNFNMGKGFVFGRCGLISRFVFSGQWPINQRISIKPTTNDGLIGFFNRAVFELFR